MAKKPTVRHIRERSTELIETIPQTERTLAALKAELGDLQRTCSHKTFTYKHMCFEAYVPCGPLRAECRCADCGWEHYRNWTGLCSCGATLSKENGHHVCPECGVQYSVQKKDGGSI